MSQDPEPTARTHPDPADSVLLSLARAVAGAGTSTGSNASWPRLDLSDPAQRQFGDYELLEEIGRGGMGVVYRARQASLDREVAIKFIADWFADPTAVARFLAEARAAARLLHPNIVPVHEVGSVQGLHYFSMPLIRGDSLASKLASGPLPPADAIALLLTLCEAIDYAHRLGLLHLDLKPANVLIDPRGQPLVADFGLARHMDERGGVDAQEVSGTPSFMAPEQILIKQYRLTIATDIYALGAILYRCLTGVSPHGEGRPDEVMQRATAGRIRRPREIAPKLPRDLEAICMKCLELLARDRYASVAQLADDLRRARDGLAVSVRRPSPIERIARWYRRERKYAVAMTLLAGAVIAGLAISIAGWIATIHQRNTAEMQRDLNAALCSGDAMDVLCQHPDAIASVLHYEPDNAFGWLLLAIADHGDQRVAALHEAARRDRFDDHYMASVIPYLTSLDPRGKPRTADLTGFIAYWLNRLAPNDRPEDAVALLMASPAYFTVPGWKQLSDRCDPRKQPLDDTLRADCLKIGTIVMRSKSSMQSRWFGSRIILQLARGTPLGDEALAWHRRWIYLTFKSDWKLSQAQRLNYPAARYLQDLSTQGEMEAYADRLEYYGIPSQPPAGWVADNPSQNP